MFKNINDMNIKEKIEYYKNKVMVKYFDDKDINLIEISEDYLSKDELKHFKELHKRLLGEV